ncbi:lysostaphin resistance A-like protein [Halorubrum sp. AD140]|uniref:CPBP family intramembrane glutamic endopeptidase n=1 Tax=Halorubrum sp. AD140 TaxID=3050073 RepID=UPI002ACCCD7D|nr:lysostaphin resistance A-like protein [Halorubrum sp. AD140]MDZ5810408.1 lysostaphin resistance A-like protein [Halorubrum sp. AD140]
MSDPASDDANRPGRVSSDGGEPSDGSTATAGTDDPPSTAAATDDATTADGSDGRSVAVAVATALLLGLLGPAIAILSGGVVLGVNALTGGLPLAAALALTLVLGQYVAFGGLAVVYLTWRGFDRAGIVSYLGVRRPSLRDLGLILGSWVLILITIMVVSVVIQLLGTEAASNQSAELAMQNPAVIPLLVAASFLVIAPSEEILYRGVVQGRLRETLPAAPAIVIASAIFAFVHVMALTGGASARLTTVSILFLPSLVFGAVYEYTENLVVPILLHGLHNAVIFTLLYVSIAYADEIQRAAEGGATLLPL